MGVRQEHRQLFGIDCARCPPRGRSPCSSAVCNAVINHSCQEPNPLDGKQMRGAQPLLRGARQAAGMKMLFGDLTASEHCALRWQGLAFHGRSNTGPAAPLGKQSSWCHSLKEKGPRCP